MNIAEKLTTVAENIPKVFEAGYNKGKSEGGGDSYYDAFWDAYQDYGSRRNYTYAFSYEGWNDKTFNPKYPIIATGNASYMFDSCQVTDFDFVEKGITFDTSGATSLTYCFRQCKGIYRIGTIDCTGCSDLNRIFYACKMPVIDNFIVHENLTYTNTFDYATIEDITVSGTIGKNGFKLTTSTLAKKSIISIINALSTTTSGLAITLSKTAVNNAFATSEGASDGSTSEEWLSLIATKSNWTISLS